MSRSSLSFVPALIRACLQGGGGPQIGEVTCGGSPHLSCKLDQIKMRDYMGRRVTSLTLRWLNTVLAVSEYMSFANLWQEKGCRKVRKEGGEGVVKGKPPFLPFSALISSFSTSSRIIAC